MCTTADYKRQRKHEKKLKKREQILDDRTCQRTGDYGSGKAFEESSEDEQDQEPAQPTIKKTKGKLKKFCRWCDAVTSHATWRSKECIAHNQYKIWQAEQNAIKVKNKIKSTVAEDKKNKTV